MLFYSFFIVPHVAQTMPMNSNKIETEMNMSLVFNQNALLKAIPFTFKGDEEPNKKNRISRVGTLMKVLFRMSFTLIPF